MLNTFLKEGVLGRLRLFRLWELRPCFALAAAPVSTVLSIGFGHRLVVMVGGLLVSVGMVIASFSQKVYHMYIAIGIISGKCFSWARSFSRDLASRTMRGRAGGGNQIQSVFLSPFLSLL